MPLIFLRLLLGGEGVGSLVCVPVPGAKEPSNCHPIFSNVEEKHVRGDL